MLTKEVFKKYRSEVKQLAIQALDYAKSHFDEYCMSPSQWMFMNFVRNDLTLSTLVKQFSRKTQKKVDFLIKDLECVLRWEPYTTSAELCEQNTVKPTNPHSSLKSVESSEELLPEVEETLEASSESGKVENHSKTSQMEEKVEELTVKSVVDETDEDMNSKIRERLLRSLENIFGISTGSIGSEIRSAIDSTTSNASGSTETSKVEAMPEDFTKLFSFTPIGVPASITSVDEVVGTVHLSSDDSDEVELVEVPLKVPLVRRKRRETLRLWRCSRTFAQEDRQVKDIEVDSDEEKDEDFYLIWSR
jgi:hypothetical protein